MNLIFDFDGTLCDSLDEAIVIANQFLRLLGKSQLTRELVRQKGMKQVLIDYQVPTYLLPFFMLYYRWQAAKRINNMPLFPGLETVIPQLAKKHSLGIVTSNSVANVESFLSRYKLRKHFSFIGSELSWIAKDKKVLTMIKTNKIDIKTTYYIGDETRDVLSMKRIGVPMIAVSWGLEEKKLLQSQQPFKVIDDPQELLSEKLLQR